MADQRDYAKAYIGLLTAAGVFSKRAKKIREDFGVLEGDAKLNALLAHTYVSGLVDMAAAHAEVLKGESMGVVLTRMENKIDGLYTGMYAEEQ